MSLYSSSGPNLLSTLHSVASEVSPGRMYSKMSDSWCMYLISTLLVIRLVLSYDWGTGVNDIIGVRYYSVSSSNTDVFVVLSYSEISVGSVIGMYV